jgi:hypothetical protein
MKKFAIVAALLGAAAPAAVTAAEVTGGFVKLGYSALADDVSFSRFGFAGSVEVAFSRQFSVQGDLGYATFGESDLDGTALGLHGIYHLDDATSFGAFYTREDVGDGDADIYGIEAGYEAGQWEFEGHFGRTDDDDDDATIFGLMGRYALSNGLGITGSYDEVDVAGTDVSRIGLMLDRDVANNLNLFLEVGSVEIDIGNASDSDPFVGLGGKITFGADRGATFEQRGFLRLIPGL